MPGTFHKMPLSLHLDHEMLDYFMNVIVDACRFTTFLKEPMNKAVSFASSSPPVPALCKQLRQCTKNRKKCDDFIVKSMHDSIFGGSSIIECPLGIQFVVGPMIFARGAATSAIISGYVRTEKWSEQQKVKLKDCVATLNLDVCDLVAMADEIPVITKQELLAAAAFVSGTAQLLMHYAVLKHHGHDNFLNSDMAIAREVMRKSNSNEQIDAEGKYAGPYNWQEEYAIVEAVAAGERKKAEQMLSDILASMYPYYVYRPREFKGRIMELAVLITRAPLFHKQFSEGKPVSLHMLPELYPPVGSNVLAMKEWIFVVLDQVMDAIDCVTEKDFRALVVRDALGFINDNLDRKITLDDVAKETGFSPDHLSRMFRDEVGVAFSEYVNIARIEEAKRWLRISTISISQIGKKLSFWDSTHFTKVFRKWTGLTPSEYRKQEMGKNGDAR